MVDLFASLGRDFVQLCLSILPVILIFSQVKLENVQTILDPNSVFVDL